MKIGGYSYYWNDTQKRGDQRQIGVLAQEVSKFFPDIVNITEDGSHFVNYSLFVPIFIESFKEQQKINIQIGDTPQQ